MRARGAREAHRELPDLSSSRVPCRVERHLRRYAKRIGLRRGLRFLFAVTPWVLLAFVALIVLGRYGLVHPVLMPSAFGVLAILALATLSTVLLRTPTPARTALALDLRLGAREVISAAWEAGPRSRHPLGLEARRRAASLLGSPQTRRVLPLLDRGEARSTLFALAALALAPLIPLPERASPPLPPHAAEVQTAGEEVHRALESIQNRLEETARPDAAEALEELEKLAEQMRTGEVRAPEDALASLEELDRELAAVQEQAEARARATGLEQVIEELAEDAFTAELAQALEAADTAALRTALERMAGALPGDTAERRRRSRQMERLADRLSEMASLLRGVGEQELAGLLKEAAEALREGDMQRAREILSSEAFAEALEGVLQAGGTGDSELARDLRGVLQQARWLLGGMAPMPLQEGQCAGGAPCGKGAGPMPGTASTNERGGSYLTGDPILRDRQGDATSDRMGEFEALYGSRLSEPGAWEDVQTTGKVGESGEMVSEAGLSLGVDTGASAPLQPLPSPASLAPEGATDLERVPPGYRDLVRRYFRRSPESSTSGESP